ncbi:MAG: TRAP transporter small permease subunit [Rhodomicrobiaceae bacterium]
MSYAHREDALSISSRLFAWIVVFFTFAFLLNNYLTHWRDWPGALQVFSGGSSLSLVQAGIYVAGVILAVFYVLKTAERHLRADCDVIYGITAYLIRGFFWAVLLIGIADLLISFLRIEDFLPALVGDEMATNLGRSNYRGPYVHMPIAALGFVIAAFTRGLAFHWLAILVVMAELLIVISRFIFSYEQAFMADLVRFWYAALFLFASAYTLIDEGHVRVDVLYASFGEPRKGIVNAFGSIFLGMSVCLTIMFFGMGSKSAVVNGPMLIYETTQASFGLFVKYWMAGFLGIFAISMMIQFAGFFLEGIADYRGEPNKRAISPVGAH